MASTASASGDISITANPSRNDGAAFAGRRVVVLGTGGTIAGKAASISDNVGYTAGQVAVADLIGGMPGLSRGGDGVVVEAEQVAQLDSKDMGHATWRRLAERAAQHLARPDVAGVVVTHGTDTLEETAYLLDRVLAPHKPLVLTAAIGVALHPQAGGVVIVIGGEVWSGAEARKVHPYRLQAFDAGDAGPIAYIEEGRLRTLRAWPRGPALGVQVLAAEVWPEVQIVHSHAGADGRVVELLLEAGVQGLVVACTGNGTVHHDLMAALMHAQQRGVAVLRALRQGAGVIVPGGHDTLPAAGGLTPAQARVELLLRLLAQG
jgi:L-asparaginase